MSKLHAYGNLGSLKVVKSNNKSECMVLTEYGKVKPD